MASHSEIAKRWAEEVGKDRPRYIGSGRQNVYVDRDRIYSYGSHFEMGRLIGTRENGFFLLNGDRYSVTTSGHQNRVRKAAQATGLPVVIIPYTALNAAGIERDSIRPLSVEPDRVDSWTEDVGPAWEIGPDTVVGFSGSYEPSDYDGAVFRNHRNGNFTATETLRGYDYTVNEFRNYWPGENVSYYYNGSSVERVGDRYYYNGSSVERVGDRFHVRRYRHFLGACVFTASVAGRKTRAKFISAFDDEESRPLYFLAELPRCNARTYEEAINALAPRIVHAARAQGREVKRQGDIFAIPTNLTRADLRKRGAAFGKRVKLLGTDHAGTEVAHVAGAVYARGCLYHDVGRWRERDHARVKMGDGKQWHLIARNTVPRRRVTAGRARA